jgi:hypothetical protein
MLNAGVYEGTGLEACMINPCVAYFLLGLGCANLLKRVDENENEK